MSEPLPGRYDDGHYDTCAIRADEPCDCPARSVERLWEELADRVERIRALEEEEQKADDLDDRIGIRFRRREHETFLGQWVVRNAACLADSVQQIAVRGIA